MTDNSNQERRKYERYGTEIKVYFQVAYDIETVVKFQVVDTSENKVLSEKYSALSRNVSAEGLCFVSDRKLEKGNILHLEVYLPKAANPIPMKGEVRWSQPLPDGEKDAPQFMTGVRLTRIDSKPVADSIFFDKEHKMIWSAVLEAIFGNFRKFAQEKLRPPAV